MIYKKILLLPLSLLIIGCGDSTETTQGKGSLDFKNYLPSSSVSKNYKQVEKKAQIALTNQFYTEVITVDGSTLTTKILGITDNVVTINDDNATLTAIDVANDGNISSTLNRYVDVGYTLVNKDSNTSQTLTLGSQETGTKVRVATLKCTVDEELNGFVRNDNVYTGDILKIKCIETATVTTTIKDEFIGQITDINGSVNVVDIYYLYYKNGVGLVSSIDDNCYPNDNLSLSCDDSNLTYLYKYYLGD